MTKLSTLVAAIAIVLQAGAAPDALAQWHGFHDHYSATVVSHHFGFPTFPPPTLCTGCGCLPCAQPICVAPPPVVVAAPVFMNMAPAIPRLAARPPRENLIPPVVGADAQPPGPFDALEEIRRRAAVLKPSTPAGRTRADRMISAGDTAFAEQVYARATSKYRDAIARAPDYAESHFRLAHAYVATRRYNLALNSAMIALELAGTARRDRFSLEEMYRGNKFARQQHDAKLLDASLREPTDGGLQFLIGFTLHYGGNPLKAREHFRQAVSLPGPHQAYVRHFLPVQPVAEAEVAAANGN